MLFDSTPSSIKVYKLSEADKSAFQNLSADDRADAIVRLQYVQRQAEHAQSASQRIRGNILPADITIPVELALTSGLMGVLRVTGFASYLREANSYLAKSDNRDKASLVAINTTIKTAVDQLVRLHYSSPATVTPRSEYTQSTISKLAAQLSKPVGTEFDPALAIGMIHCLETLKSNELLQLKEFGAVQSRNAAPRLFRELIQAGMSDSNISTFKAYCTAAIIAGDCGIGVLSSTGDIARRLELSRGRAVA